VVNFPDSPSVDEIYSVGDKSWLWNGTYWEVQGAPSSTFSASDTAPADPDAGDIWYRSDTSQTLLFYDNTWVEIGHSANVPTFFADNDGDTKIQVEESADEDVIRFDVAGAEKAFINSTGLTVSGDIEVTGSYVGLSSNSISDADGDTKIQVEESADEDTIRFDTAGVERMTIGSSGTVSVAGDLSVTGTISGVEDPYPIVFMMMGA